MSLPLSSPYAQGLDRNAANFLPLIPLRFLDRLLTLAAENPGGSLARIARALCVTPPHVTAVVDRLEARSLVTRKPSHEDRRTQTLNATDAGMALARKATERILAAERRLPLSVGEQAILAELLHKVACARDASGRPGLPG